MGRWTQYDDDKYRLPDGVRRIGYDADSGVYTYKDDRGVIYEGLPHQEYGKLKPQGQSSAVKRPMFDKDKSQLKLDTGKAAAGPKSFADILSPDQVTAATPISDGKPFSRSPSSSPVDPKSRFISAVRRVAMPKMQNVVNSVMSRSASRPSDTESIREKLLPRETRFSSDSTPPMSELKSTPLTRSATSAQHRSSSRSLERSSTMSSSLTRSSTTSSHRSSSSLVRSATNASSSSGFTTSAAKPLSSSGLLRSATSAASRSGSGLARSATNASTRSSSSIGHLMNAKPMRVASMKDLPNIPSGLPEPPKSTRPSSHSSSRRRPVEAV